ncbi:MAG: FAD-dependent oxidoreductase [Nitrospira sp.]|nr:FAD-dependent oxidoreductase [Nitrospira sp.]
MKRQVLIIGGGLAGLTAALRLSKDYAVTLVDQGSELGGRLLEPDTATCHSLLLGYEQATVSLLQTLGTAAQVPFSNHLGLEFLLPSGPSRRPHGVRWRRPWLPAPFHAILGLAFFRGLSLRDRWRLLLLLERTWEGDPPLPADLEHRTASAWLVESGQSPAAIEQIWNPLAHFLVGNALEHISAAILIATMTRCFLAARRNAALAILNPGIRPLILEPAREHLLQAGAVLRLESAVEHIRFDTHRITGVQLRTGGTLTADWYIAALPHRHLTPLLPERALTRFAYFQHLTKLTDTPALTVHLWLDRPPPRPRVALLAGRPFHWLLCRAEGTSTDHRAHLSLTATDRPDLLAKPDQELLALALDEVNAVWLPTGVAGVKDYRIVREPHAFLSLGPGTAALRPLQQSPFPNLFLAGDWTDTGLPATLESAVQSGVLCAEAIQAKQTGTP